GLRDVQLHAPARPQRPPLVPDQPADDGGGYSADGGAIGGGGEGVVRVYGCRSSLPRPNTHTATHPHPSTSVSPPRAPRHRSRRPRTRPPAARQAGWERGD